MHPLNRRTHIWIGGVAAFVVAFVVIGLLIAREAEAHIRHRSRGFEPSAATLACINQAEGGPSYSHDGRKYDGAYQMDRRFAMAYSAAIGPEHWALWESDRSAPTWTWAPAIQDEVARNGIRARGTQPWPPARRCR